jgi:hypothetical protein
MSRHALAIENLSICENAALAVNRRAFLWQSQLTSAALGRNQIKIIPTDGLAKSKVPYFGSQLKCVRFDSKAMDSRTSECP